MIDSILFQFHVTLSAKFLRKTHKSDERNTNITAPER